MRYQLAWFIATVNYMATVTVLNGLMESNPPNFQRRGCFCVGLENFQLLLTAGTIAVARLKSSGRNTGK